MEESFGLYPEKQKMLTGQKTGRDVCISDICTSRSFVKNRSVEEVYFSDYNRAEAILLKGWGRGIVVCGMDVD